MDELPNLFNVIKGEMSIIGPRPPLPREVAHYDAYHMQRLAAVPGMTGLWQVRGRSEIPFEEMVAKAKRMALRHGIAGAGDRVILIAGVPFGTPGSTNVLHAVRVAGDELERHRAQAALL